jgi:hypothetical protein
MAKGLGWLSPWISFMQVFGGVWINWGVHKLFEVVMRREETPCLWVAITEDEIREPESAATTEPISLSLPAAVDLLRDYTTDIQQTSSKHGARNFKDASVSDGKSQLQTPWIPTWKIQLLGCSNLSIRKVPPRLWHAAANIHAGRHVDFSMLTVQCHSHGMLRYIQDRTSKLQLGYRLWREHVSLWWSRGSTSPSHTDFFSVMR